MERHSKVCQTAIRSYILNGPNRKVSDANANAQVGESGVCPADGFSAVSDTRAKAKLLTAAEAVLQNDTIDYQSAVDYDNENLKYKDNFGIDLTIATLGGAIVGGVGFAGVRELLLPVYRKQERIA